MNSLYQLVNSLLAGIAAQFFVMAVVVVFLAHGSLVHHLDV